MNRQQRRKLEREGYSKSQVLNKSLDELKKQSFDIGYQKGFDEGIEVASKLWYYMTAYTIQYKLDFGKKRLGELMTAIANNIDAYSSEHLTPDDYETIRDMMVKKYGLYLQVK